MGPEKTEPSKAVAFSFGASTAAAAAPTPASSGFTKASADVLSKRKIIRTRRPQQSSTPSAPSGGGVFGGISLVPASGASTVPLKPAAPSKPAFVLPSSTPASSFSMSSSSSSKSMSTSSSKPVSEEEKELNTKFVDFLRNLPDRYFFDMACVQFINRLNIIRKKNQSIASLRVFFCSVVGVFQKGRPRVPIYLRIAMLASCFFFILKFIFLGRKALTILGLPS